MEDTDEAFEDTQYTPEARERYLTAVDEAVTALRRHADTVAAATGRAREITEQIESGNALTRALTRVNDAEFDWCGSGSIPLLDLGDEDEEDEEDAAEEPAGGFLTVLARWDYRVEDPEALVRAGRRAYLDVWPEDLPEDAEIRVDDVAVAAYEIGHGTGRWDPLEVPGAEGTESAVSFLVHDGSRWPPADTDGTPVDLVSLLDSTGGLWAETDPGPEAR